MRIRDITENTIEEGPIWNKVKAGVKKIFAPGEKKHPLVTNQGQVKNIFGKLRKGEKLNHNDMQTVNDIYNQI